MDYCSAKGLHRLGLGQDKIRSLLSDAEDLNKAINAPLPR